MSALNNHHIDYTEDLRRPEIVLENFHDEMIDHVCSAVEVEMKNGRRDAYHEVLRSFGSIGKQLRQIPRIFYETNKIKN